MRMPATSSHRSPVSASISSTRMAPSHLASSLSPTQYLCAKFPVHRLAGLCLHSTQDPLLHPWFLRSPTNCRSQPHIALPQLPHVPHAACPIAMMRLGAQKVKRDVGLHQSGNVGSTCTHARRQARGSVPEAWLPGSAHGRVAPHQTRLQGLQAALLMWEACLGLPPPVLAAQPAGTACVNSSSSRRQACKAGDNAGGQT